MSLEEALQTLNELISAVTRMLGELDELRQTVRELKEKLNKRNRNRRK